MLTPSAARGLAAEFDRSILRGGPDEWRAGAERLAALDGRDRLLLDEAARSPACYGGPAPVSGGRGSSITEPTGFVAAVTSMHADGRVRERATVVLAGGTGRLRAAALALRAMDHVPQVREAALRALASGRDADDVEAALAVLLAGERRRHTPSALDAVRSALVGDERSAELITSLTGSPRRPVRRWAFELAHGQRLLSPQRLLAAAATERDQLLAARCAEWLLESATAEQVVALLGVRSVEARMAALSRVPDTDLDDAVLLPMLLHRSPRLREVAQWRARRRGLDVTGWYRDRLAARTLSASGWAAGLDALRRTGDPADLDLFLPGLEHPVPAVRAAALSGVGALAPADRARELVGPLLLDPSPRVSTTAARVLAADRTGGARAAAAWASLAWASPRPDNRHTAWRLSRSTGGWDRVEADLRAAGDPDPRIAAAGQSGTRNWLASSAATTWQALAPERRERIGDLIEAWDAPERERSTLAFHAGITRPVSGPGLPVDEAPVDEAPVVREKATRRVLRFLRRG